METSRRLKVMKNFFNNNNNNNNNKSRKVSTIERLNNIAILWFWFTMIGVYYAGVVDVLPVIYTTHVSVLWLNRIFCTFVFLEIAINWACVRYVTSYFRPEEHRTYVESHKNDVEAGGYEIDLDHVTRNPDEEGCTIPVKAINSLDGSSPIKLSSKTLYVISLSPEDAGSGFSGSSNGGSSGVRHVVYPYWSWKPCVSCHVIRPPRAHHCPICSVCVLKRDHHCFFTGSCVGLRNQRHFVVFSFWSAVITSYCMVHAAVYVHTQFLLRHPWFDLLLPVALIRSLLGYISHLDAMRVTLLYSVAWFLMTSLGFLLDQCRVITRGATSFELDNNMKVINTGSLSDNIRAVFGDKWWLNFLLPVYRIYPESENGVVWKNLKVP